MPLCSTDPEYVDARKVLGKAVEEFARITEQNGSLMIGATAVFDVTCYDDNGVQNYAVRHVILDPGSLAHSAGLLAVAKDRIVNYINDPNDPDSHDQED